MSSEFTILKGLPPQLKMSVNGMLFNMLWTFVLGEATLNYSQVDRVWTFLPPLYTIFYTLYPLLDSAPLGIKTQGIQPRAVLMMFLQVIWSARLSYQANRRGFFSWNSEDYRWIVFRDWVPVAPILKYLPTKYVLTLFNLGFISIFQNILLFLLAIPSYAVSVNSEPLHWGDAMLAGLVLLAIGLEFISDNQQFAYQNFKYTSEQNVENEWPGSRIVFTLADKERGFITKGLWAYSRHPNCACEQSIWLFMSLFPLITNPHLAENAVDMILLLTPTLLLDLLFLSSTAFTESISKPKYPTYSLYQKRVGMFWPTQTALKALWLYVRGTKSHVEQLLWSDSVVQVRAKKSE